MLIPTEAIAIVPAIAGNTQTHTQTNKHTHTQTDMGITIPRPPPMGGEVIIIIV